jgi:hypothetical protein
MKKINYSGSQDFLRGIVNEADGGFCHCHCHCRYSCSFVCLFEALWNEVEGLVYEYIAHDTLLFELDVPKKKFSSLPFDIFEKMRGLQYWLN